MAYTMGQYVQQMQAQQPQYVQTFELPQGNDKMLEVNFGVPSGNTGQQLTTVWTKAGSMVAYRGDISFKREGVMEHGIGHMIKKKLTEENSNFVKASARGRAQLYLADYGKIVTIFRLQGDSITVNGNDLLAFEPSVKHKIQMLKGLTAMAAAGVFNVTLSGHGFVAVLTHGKPITLTVGAGQPPVFTDAEATVAWSGELVPEFKTDIGFRTLIGRGSGETFQMKFDGNRGSSGFVLVQPYEEKGVSS